MVNGETTIHALLFDLECRPPTFRQLVVWLDDAGRSEITQHAHPDRTLLDVEVGHVIVNRGKQYVVTNVKLYRTTLCRDETAYPPVISGRSWLEEMRSAG